MKLKLKVKSQLMNVVELCRMLVTDIILLQ